MRIFSLPLNAFLVLSLVLVSFGLVGCGGNELSEPIDRGRVTSRAMPRERGDAAIRLREVFRRYQVCSSYRDDGIVTLRAKSSDTSGFQSITAPLRIEFSQASLAVDAYASRIRVRPLDVIRSSLGEQQIELTAWFDEVESSHFDSQVLRSSWTSAFGERFEIEQVLADEVLRSRLSAGLAGPPPQLEWLLADEPMSKLFENSAREAIQCQWEPDRELSSESSSALLQRIAVTSDNDRFVFWIEPTTSLIRRVELPLPQSTVDQTGWSLTLDLNQATFQPSDGAMASKFQNSPDFNPVLVRRFVPIPPPPPSPLLGRTIDRDLFEGEANHFKVIAVAPRDSTLFEAWKRDWSGWLTVLAPVAKIQFIVHDQGMASQLRDFPSPPVSVKLEREAKNLLRKLRLDEGAMVLLGQYGRVLLIESSSQSGSIGNMISVIRDTSAGVDVPQRIRDDYDQILNVYQSALDRVRVQP